MNMEMEDDNAQVPQHTPLGTNDAAPREHILGTARKRSSMTVEESTDSTSSVLEHKTKQLRLGSPTQAVAPSLSTFVKDRSHLPFLPRPEWLETRFEATISGECPERPKPVYTVGKDMDSVLHSCIRSGEGNPAMRLIEAGANVHVENSKGVTPITLAAQTGDLEVLQALQQRGADLEHLTYSGASAALQAAHFGHLKALRHILSSHRGLLELSNDHKTTPLMRASQGGYVEVVKYLCGLGALVNRRNDEGMSALMLAAQRGHAQVCQFLINEGADVDAMTSQQSTSLMLAIKRQNVQAISVLVSSGCELYVKDARGRTAQDIVLQRTRHRAQNTDTGTRATILELLNPIVQVDLMRRQARRDRSWAWIRIWTLLQQDRARLRGVEDTPLHQALPLVEERRPFSKQHKAWLRTLALPAPLIRSIVQFAPLPSLWQKRISRLANRCTENPNAALELTFDLIDEVLEEGGFLVACDQALIPPPVDFASWQMWKRWCCRSVDPNPNEEACHPLERTNHHKCYPPVPSQDPKALVQLRRGASYLRLLYAHESILKPTLTLPPFRMPTNLVEHLVTVSDICSLIRRMGSYNDSGVQFSTSVAMDLTVFTSQLCLWHSNGQR